MAEDKKLVTLTTADMCDRYHVSRRTIDRWRAERIIPAPVVIGALPRWLLKTLEAWEAAGCPKPQTRKRHQNAQDGG